MSYFEQMLTTPEIQTDQDLQAELKKHFVQVQNQIDAKQSDWAKLALMNLSKKVDAIDLSTEAKEMFKKYQLKIAALIQEMEMEIAKQVTSSKNSLTKIREKVGGKVNGLKLEYSRVFWFFSSWWSKLGSIWKKIKPILTKMKTWFSERRAWFLSLVWYEERVGKIWWRFTAAETAVNVVVTGSDEEKEREVHWF